MRKYNLKPFFLGVAVALVLFGSALGGAIADRVFDIDILDHLFEKSQGGKIVASQKIVNEESVVIDIAEKVSPSVVTVTVETPRRRILEFSPFGGGFSSRIEGGEPQDIGTGFIVSEEGLVITNRHVVSDAGVKYKVVTKDDKEYDVTEINRDPANDLAIIKIDPAGVELKAIELGDSGNLKVGQFVVAIGTALGEFRHTVTTGVISGLGRGIVAGSPYEGYVERLDDVIQTDAAINPGNSGGPLLNSSGQVVGVNVAIAQGAQNIGFAIPINILKDRLNEFKSNGKFEAKPFLGVEYQMISEQAAILNDVPQGAFVVRVVEGSPAANAGIREDDIIVEIDGKNISNQEEGLAGVISEKKPGDLVKIEIWRDAKTVTLDVTLTEFSE